MISNLHITKQAEDDWIAEADCMDLHLFHPLASDDFPDKAEENLSSLAELPHIRSPVGDPFLKPEKMRELNRLYDAVRNHICPSQQRTAWRRMQLPTSLFRKR